MSWLKPKNVENYTGMESEQAFGDEMPNFDICGTVDVLDVDAKTETPASSENKWAEKYRKWAIRSIV